LKDFRQEYRAFAPGVVHFLTLNAAELQLEHMIFRAECYCIVNTSRLDTLA
jgi:hypothetical protein